MKKAVFAMALFSVLLLSAERWRYVYADVQTTKITNPAAVATIAGLVKEPMAEKKPEAPAAAVTPDPKPPEPVIVEVAAGDTLTIIAETHDTTYSRLFDANESIQNPDIIQPGDKIRIPAADEQITSRPLPAAPVLPQTPQTTAYSPRVALKAVQASSAPAVASGSVWDQLAACESGGNWAINTGNGFYGGLQFTLATWKGVGGSGYPNENSREEQIARAEILLARSGWGQWPACTLKLGLR